jgi:hypothetical protein
LAPAYQYPHPDLLKEVLGHLPVAGQIKQVAQQPVLVANDQLVQQAGVLPLETRRYGEALLPHQLLIGCGGSRTEKRANERRCTHLTQLDDKNALQVAER